MKVRYGFFILFLPVAIFAGRELPIEKYQRERNSTVHYGGIDLNRLSNYVAAENKRGKILPVSISSIVESIQVKKLLEEKSTFLHNSHEYTQRIDNFVLHSLHLSNAERKALKGAQDEVKKRPRKEPPKAIEKTKEETGTSENQKIESTFQMFSGLDESLDRQELFQNFMKKKVQCDLFSLTRNSKIPFFYNTSVLETFLKENENMLKDFSKFDTWGEWSQIIAGTVEQLREAKKMQSWIKKGPLALSLGTILSLSTYFWLEPTNFLLNSFHTGVNTILVLGVLSSSCNASRTVIILDQYINYIREVDRQTRIKCREHHGITDHSELE